MISDSLSCFGALHRKSPRGGSAYGMLPKKATGPLGMPSGLVVLPAKAAYPRLMTGPKREVSKGSCSALLTSGSRRRMDVVRMTCSTTGMR